MARTLLVKTTAPGTKASVGALLTVAAADLVNKNSFKAEGKDLIIAHNSGATPHTVTVTSSPDQMGRLGHITAFEVPAGRIAIFGALDVQGWIQPDGAVYLEANHAEIKLGVVKL